MNNDFLGPRIPLHDILRDAPLPTPYTRMRKAAGWRKKTTLCGMLNEAVRLGLFTDEEAGALTTVPGSTTSTAWEKARLFLLADRAVRVWVPHRLRTLDGEEGAKLAVQLEALPELMSKASALDVRTRIRALTDDGTGPYAFDGRGAPINFLGDLCSATQNARGRQRYGALFAVRAAGTGPEVLEGREEYVTWLRQELRDTFMAMVNIPYPE